MRYRHAFALVLILLSLAPPGTVAPLRAQPNRIIPVEDWTYFYVQRLQRRGYLLELHPTALPYTQGAVAEALDALDRSGLNRVEARWVALLERELGLAPAAPDEAVFSATLGAGIALADTKRLDPARPLRSDFFAYPNALLHVLLDRGRVVAHLGPRHDVYYDRDPDGIDTALRFMVRSDNSYVGLNGSFASLYAGRFGNLWGRPGQAATLVSDNPRNYDHLNLRIGGPRFAVRSLLGELDSITGDGRYTGAAGADSVRSGSERRYLAAHRFDWRPTPRLSFTLMEGSLYSGANAGFSLKYLNPVHPFIFLVDNAPKDEENNGFFAGMMWAQFGRLTLHGQLIFDDFDPLNNEEPTAFAMVGSVHYAGRSGAADLGGTLEVITGRAYNAEQVEGQYIYLKRGLATQFNDYVHATAFVDLYLDALLPGLVLTPRLHLLAQGEGDIRTPFPTDGVPSLLSGTVERTVRPAVQVTFQNDPRWWVRLDLGINRITNRGAVEDADVTRFVGLVEAGARLRFTRAYRLAF